MIQMDEYKRGHRDAIRFAVTWLHQRAGQMNDPTAKAVLNVAATDLGSEYSRNSHVSPADRNTEAG